MWGVDFLFYMPVTGSGPFHSSFCPIVCPRVSPANPRLDRKPFPSRCGAGAAACGSPETVVVLILAIAAFLTLSSARHFLGDGYYLLR